MGAFVGAGHRRWKEGDWKWKCSVHEDMYVDIQEGEKEIFVKEQRYRESLRK